MRLQGRVGLITGAGRGLGREIALAYAAEGADVSLAARTLSEVEEVAEEVRALGRHALARATDVSKEREVHALVEHTVQELGRLDVLVNNAGVGFGKRGTKLVWELELEEWQEVLDVNLTGAFLCARAVLPVMMRQGSGVIINISSGMQRLGRPEFAAYCASKGGLDALSLVLANEARPYNIRVNALAPGGGTATRPVLEKGLFAPEDLLHPDVIRGAAVWLASEDSDGVTGQFFCATDWNRQHAQGEV